MTRQRSSRKRSGAIAKSRPNAVQNWLLRHFQVMLAALGRLSQYPVSTLMTSTVIGIAVCLPAGMWTILDNVKQLSGSLDGAASISLFLQIDANEQQISDLQQRLLKRNEIADIQLISRDAALAEFRQLSGFGDALDLLESNPLPAVMVVMPSRQHSTPAASAILLQSLKTEPLVDIAQLDLEWVKRLSALTQVAFRAVLILGTVLALAVLLIIGNTIRLEIQNRRAEIEISKLVGATNGFIQRPFLYTGFWYGLLGGLTAWLMVTVSLWLLAGPAETLSLLYNSSFELNLPGFSASLVMIFSSTLLGVAGAQLAVSRHLHAIEPE